MWCSIGGDEQEEVLLSGRRKTAHRRTDRCSRDCSTEQPRQVVPVHDYDLGLGYVDDGRFWRFTRQQTEDVLRALWPDEAADILRLLGQIRVRDGGV